MYSILKSIIKFQYLVQEPIASKQEEIKVYLIYFYSFNKNVFDYQIFQLMELYMKPDLILLKDN